MPHWLEVIIRKKELNSTGVFVGDIHNADGYRRLPICFLRGLMIFLATYATIFGFMDAFEFDFNRIIVLAFLLFISMFVAMLYLHKTLFYSGYFLILIVFTVQLVNFYLYANSGFQAIMNVIYEKYSDYYKLLSLRDALEIYSNRYVTVTVALIFIGTFLAMLLNITISGYMNLFETFLITFPFIELALFIDIKPPIHYIIILVGIYLSVAIQQFSKNFRMQVKGKHTKEYFTFKHKNEHKYFYQSNPKGIISILLISFTIAIIVCSCLAPLYYSTKQTVKKNVIRTEMDNLVKNYVQSGIDGLLNRYKTKGGVDMNGSLGGVSSVRPDFQTDLIVTFVPYSYNTVYLKSFTGSTYHDNQWLPHSYESFSFDSSTASIFLSQKKIEEFDRQYMPLGTAQAKMKITDVDLFLPQGIYPYYSLSDDRISLQGESVTIDYSPYFADVYSLSDTELPDSYYEYVNWKCLQTPLEIMRFLHDYCEEYDLYSPIELPYSEDGEANDYEVLTAINQSRINTAYRVYSHFISDYDYTMSPGATPYNQDYVEYFLSEQKRGFCAHFASSAVLLLRSMGIPCRYAEGYIIPPTLVAQGTAISEKQLSNWYTGPSELSEQGLISVEITDLYAHAWIEIYLEGYGFVPFEVTPADTDDDMGLPNLAGLFAGLFDVKVPLSEVESNAANANNGSTASRLFDMLPSVSALNVLIPFTIVVGIILVLLGIYHSIRLIQRKRRINQLLRTKDYATLIHDDYTDLLLLLSTKRSLPYLKTVSSNNLVPNLLPDDLCKLLSGVNFEKIKSKKAHILSRETLDKYRFYLEKGMYSSKGISSEEYILYKKFYSEILDLCKLLK